ncbi:MAG: flagellar export chaperone FliS [Balneolales bacterium]
MKNQHLEYQRQSVMQSSPEELIGKLYELATQACYQKDAARAKEILTTLIRSLNFDYEVSGTLYQLYDYCRNILDQEKYDEVINLITPLREAWDEGVIKKQQNSPSTTKSNGFIA